MLKLTLLGPTILAMYDIKHRSCHKFTSYYYTQVSYTYSRVDNELTQYLSVNHRVAPTAKKSFTGWQLRISNLYEQLWQNVRKIHPALIILCHCAYNHMYVCILHSVVTWQQTICSFQTKDTCLFDQLEL